MIFKTNKLVLRKVKRGFSIFVLFVALGLSQSFAQKNQMISGGNTVSSMVCANKQVYTWGAGGTSTPTAVVFPNNLAISQVSSGSGGHYVALDCNNAVWAWGNNTKGQLGNGTCCASTTTPAKVLANAAIPASNRNAAGELINVNFVYSGNNNSYAVLNDGKLVSWGGNSGGAGIASNDNTGQLGNGGTTDQYTANYVIDGTTNLPLTGVTEVFAGDNVTYALVGSTVYSWGAGLNGTLGRALTGGANPSNSLTVTSSKAYPVTYATGTVLGDGTIAAAGRIMNNIAHISAGDVFGMALDVNGYVWTWGNGAWNNSTGNTTVNYSGSDPRRVLKGTTTGASNDGTYLLAKSIGGGQGYGMAVTVDGKPVAWGGGGCANGGLTGNGTSLGSPTGAGYIMYGPGPGQVHNTVTTINRGDTWGSYETSDGKIYTWGCNSGIYAGVLGLGNTNDQLYATQLVPPTACGFRDPVPAVALTPGDTTVCASKFTSITLNSGFVISPALAASYSVKWYKNNVLVKSGTAANALTYPATAVGTYKVEVAYIGLNAGCIPYDVAKDSMTISTFPVTFTAPTNLTYCNSTMATVNVNSTATTNASYDWFPTSGSTTVLGTSVGSASTTIDISGSTAGTGTDKIVYVEEKAYASGTVLKKSQGCDPTWMTSSDNINNGAIADNTQSAFTVSEPVTLTTLSLMLQSQIYNVGNTYAATLTFGIYGNKTINGGLVADNTNKIGSFTYSFSRTRGTLDPQTVTDEDTVNVNFRLPKAGTYFLSMDNANITANNGQLVVGRGNCAESVPVVDNVNGTIIKYSGMSQAFSNPQTGTNITQGRFFNINFKTAQKYCDRIPVTIKQQCPCQQPASVTTNSTPAPVPATATVAKTVAVCQGTAINLTGTFVAGTNPLTSTLQHVWYKKGTMPGAYTANPIVNKALTGVIGDAGVWVLRVEDGNAGNSICYKEDSILVTLVSQVRPSVTITPAAFCAGTSTTLTATPVEGGSAPTYSWTVNAGAVVSTQNTYTSSTFKNGDVVRVVMTSNSSCAFPSNIGDTSVTVKVNPIPVATSTDVTICSGTKAVILLSSNTSGTTFNWTAAAVTGITGSNGGTSTPTDSTISQTLFSTLTTSGDVTYTVTPKTATCPGLPITVKATVNPIPNVLAAATNICSNTSTNIALSSDVTTGVSYSWTGAGNGAAAGTVSPIAELLTNASTAAATTSYSITATANTCTGPAKIVSFLVKPLPVTSGSNPAICTGAQVSIPLQHNITTPGAVSSYAWTATGSSVNVTGYAATGSSSPITATLTNTGAVDGTVTYSVTPTVDGCTGSATPIAVVVKPKPLVTATTAAPICGGNFANISFSSNVAGTTYIWTMASVPPVTGASSNGTGSDASGIAEILNNTGNKAGTATYTISPTANGCPGASVTSSITVNPAPDAVAIDQTTCSGAAFTIGINTNTTGFIVSYSWTGSVTTGTVTGFPATGTANSITGTPINTGSSDAVITYLVSPSANGCTGAVIPVKVTVHPIPIAVVVNNKPVLCSGDITSIDISSVTPGTTFGVVASGGANSLSILSMGNGSIAQALIAFSQTIVTYTTTPTNGCNGPSVVSTVTVHPIPVSDAGNVLAYCIGDSAFMGAPNNAAYSYAWSPPTDLNNPTVSAPKTTTAKTTLYTVTTTLIAYKSCLSKDSVVVTVTPKFTVYAGPDTLICAKDPVSLTATPSGLVYQWSNGATGQIIEVAPPDTTTYIVLASNGGCFARDTVVVNVKNLGHPTLYIPNSFTPNGDGLNDIFKVSGEGIIEFEGTIFNRWGELFYTWKDLNKGWNGVLSTGQPALEDIYVYSIKVKNLCDKKFNDPRSGIVTLIK